MGICDRVICRDGNLFLGAFQRIYAVWFLTSRFYEGKTSEMVPYMERFLHHSGWGYQLGKQILTSAPLEPQP